MTVIGRVKVKIYKARHVSPFVSVTEKETEAGKSIKYKMFSRKFNLADKYKTNRQPRIRLAYSVIHTTCMYTVEYLHTQYWIYPDISPAALLHSYLSSGGCARRT